MKKILVIVAHPDDEILSMGATMRKMINRGDKVKILILATGLTARESISISIENHRKNAIAANNVLGVIDVVFGDFLDNQMDTYPLIQVIKYIEKVVLDYKPDIIFTHHEFDLNVDHRVTARAVLTATRPNTPTFVPLLYTFEVLSSTDWNFGQAYSKFSPNTYIDVGDEIEYKIEAMKFYNSEIMDFPHQRSEEGIRILAMKSGSEIGIFYAERFSLIRGYYVSF